MAADLLGDRWTLLILREALYGIKRFDDIHADIGIPRAVLTARLRHLVDSGVLRREPYRDPGARTRYSYVLTESGVELAIPVIALMQWGDKYIRQKEAQIRIVHRLSGEPLQVELVDRLGNKVPVSRATFTVAWGDSGSGNELS